MALPTVSELKTYLRIETTAEDTLLTAILARAKAMLEGWIDVPITAEAQTVIDPAVAFDVPITSLICPRRPITVTSVTDTDGVVVPVADYWVDGKAGIIYGKAGVTFPYGPYTIVTTCGLSLRADYTRIEPMINEAIIDLAADLYQRRTPGAQTETAAGTSITWDTSRETVARIMKTLRTLRLGVMQ